MSGYSLKALPVTISVNTEAKQYEEKYLNILTDINVSSKLSALAQAYHQKKIEKIEFLSRENIKLHLRYVR